MKMLIINDIIIVMSLYSTYLNFYNTIGTFCQIVSYLFIKTWLSTKKQAKIGNNQVWLQFVTFDSYDYEAWMRTWMQDADTTQYEYENNEKNPEKVG